MLDIFSDFFACDLAIDLGSSNTLIYRKGKGIIVNEPSLVAFRTASGMRSPIGIGSGAKALLDHCREDISVVQPVKHGKVWDRDAGREMIAGYLQRVGSRWWKQPLRVIANAPVHASAGERRVLQEVIMSAGVREVYLLEQPRALAAGAGLDISEEKCTMIMDIGGAITEMAVIDGGRVLQVSCIPLGGEDMDRAIADHIRKRHRLRITRQTAERIKIQLGDVYPCLEGHALPVTGYHLEADIPGSVLVTALDIREALADPLRLLVTALKGFLDDLSAEQSVAILDSGIALGGGASLIQGLDRLLEREVLFPFSRVKDPLTCVVMGSGGALYYMDHFRHQP